MSYALKATYDVKESWSRMLFDEFGPGGWIAESAPEFNREHLLWSLALIRSVDGRTGTVRRGDRDIAQSLGYTGNNHPGTKTRRMLTSLGFFQDTGKKVGRAPVLRLSAPKVLVDSDKYENLRESVVDNASVPPVGGPRYGVIGSRYEVQGSRQEAGGLKVEETDQAPKVHETVGVIQPAPENPQAGHIESGHQEWPSVIDSMSPHVGDLDSTSSGGWIGIPADQPVGTDDSYSSSSSSGGCDCTFTAYAVGGGGSWLCGDRDPFGPPCDCQCGHAVA
ncbi:hypothetical protein ACFWZ2_04420 [Streptomyces sp. NPDC059002]|uniref:hypothetical protein n=1 Tax=Streptomyces sp. NPDC059002 TaxID=3346690 RepID=UPI0036CB1A0B